MQSPISATIKTSAIFIASIVISTQAQAYQFEITPEYTRYKWESTSYSQINSQSYSYSDSSSSNVLTLRGAYYLQDVKTDNHPLALAAYLERASYISASISTEDSSEDESYSMVNLDGRYYFAGSLFFVGAQYDRVSAGDPEDEVTTISAGITPLDGMELELSYATRSDGDATALEGRHVFDLGDQALELNAGFYKINYDDVDLDFGQDDSLNGSYVGAVFYFNPLASLGLTYLQQESFEPLDSYTFHGEYFVAENCSIKLTYADRSWGDDVSSDVYGIAVAMRY